MLSDFQNSHPAWFAVKMEAASGTAVEPSGILVPSVLYLYIGYVMCLLRLRHAYPLPLKPLDLKQTL